MPKSITCQSISYSLIILIIFGENYVQIMNSVVESPNNLMDITMHVHEMTALCVYFSRYIRKNDWQGQMHLKIEIFTNIISPVFWRGSLRSP
jgi:hypothetical protein